MNTAAFVTAIIALILCIFGIIENLQQYIYNPRIEYIMWIMVLTVCNCSNCYIIISNLLKLL